MPWVPPTAVPTRGGPLSRRGESSSAVRVHLQAAERLLYALSDSHSPASSCCWQRALTSSEHPATPLQRRSSRRPFAASATQQPISRQQLPLSACRTAAKEPSTSTTTATGSSSNATAQQQPQQHQYPEPLTNNPAQPAGAASPPPPNGSSSTSSSSKPKRQPQPKPQQWMAAPTAAISVSGPYLTTSSIDGDSLIMSAEFLERELVGPYKFAKHQVGVCVWE